MALLCPDCEEPIGTVERYCWNCDTAVENPVTTPHAETDALEGPRWDDLIERVNSIAPVSADVADTLVEVADALREASMLSEENRRMRSRGDGLP